MREYPRRRLQWAAVLVVLWLLPGLWFTAVPAEPPDDRELTAAIVGVWTSTATLSDGVVAHDLLRLSVDGTFAGVVTDSAGDCWTYAGTWSVEDAVLIWRYVESSIPMPDELKVDKDRIVTADGRTVVLRNAQDGGTVTLVRQVE